MPQPRITRRVQQPSYGTLPKRFPSTNFGTYTQRGLTKHLSPGVATPPATAYAPTASAAPSIGTTPAAPPADPRDSQYFNDVAKLDSYYTSRRADLTASGEQLTRDLAKNNQTLDEQQPKDTLSAKQNANKAGLFYSGALGKNLGEIETSYAKRRSDLADSFKDATGANTRALNELDTNYGPSGLMRNDALLSGIGRASSLDQTLGVNNGLAAQAAAPTALPYKTQAGTSKTGVKGMWHIYPGGRKVFVRG